MFKILTLLKRKPGTSLEEMKTYYETSHARLGEKYLVEPKRYVRRYLQPTALPSTGQQTESEFDVITEVWFEDRAAYEKAMSRMAEPEVAKQLAADEEKMFDTSKSLIFTVEEHDSIIST